MKVVRFLLISLFILAYFTACTPTDIPGILDPWDYADLRGLDPADASTPSLDLLAIYTRNRPQDLQIRLDWLDHATIPDYDLYLALDHTPGGTNALPVNASSDLDWDTLLVIPASGPFKAISPDGSLRQNTGLQVLRDAVLDTITINLHRPSLDRGLSEGSVMSHFSSVVAIQVFLTPKASTFVADQINPIRTDDPAPPPARVLFTFWNSYPAYTPALALRRLDGAHTGPLGGRHGLGNLIRTARASGIPLTLLDLKFPPSLAALDYAGALNLIRAGAQSGLLILPEFIPGLLPDLPGSSNRFVGEILADHSRVTQEYHLPTSPFIYTTPSSIPTVGNSRLVFTRAGQDPAQTAALSPVYVTRWRDQRVIPVPEGISQVEQATSVGPSLEMRRALIETALTSQGGTPGEEPILILGGDLPASTWGSPQLARASFRYIAAHPWIRSLQEEDLLAVNPAHSFDSTPTSFRPLGTLPKTESAELLAALLDAPENEFRTAAWQAYLALAAPVYPEDEGLPALRSTYVGGVWALLSAAHWADVPESLADCAQDPDHDFQSECVLASGNIMAIFEIESGALAYLFSRSSDNPGSMEVHQWISPSSQFIVGLSEPTTWDTSQGTLSDPGVIQGMWAEPGLGFQPFLDKDTLQFISADGAREKSYHLTDQGILAEYHFLKQPSTIHLLIPLSLDPWERFSSGWSDLYIEEALPWAIQWKLLSGPKVGVFSNFVLQSRNFKASQAYMSGRENPNIDYPGGHFVPFPLSIVDILLHEDAMVEIILEDSPPE